MTKGAASRPPQKLDPATNSARRVFFFFFCVVLCFFSFFFFFFFSFFFEVLNQRQTIAGVLFFGVSARSVLPVHRDP